MSAIITITKNNTQSTIKVPSDLLSLIICKPYTSNIINTCNMGPVLNFLYLLESTIIPREFHASDDALHVVAELAFVLLHVKVIYVLVVRLIGVCKHVFTPLAEPRRVFGFFDAQVLEQGCCLALQSATTIAGFVSSRIATIAIDQLIVFTFGGVWFIIQAHIASH